MIEVRLRRDERGRVSGFAVTGHASRSRGRDIVCAGVSALTDTTTMSLIRLLGDRVSVDSGPGKLVCGLPRECASNDREKADLLIDNMILGLSEISKLYPDRVTVVDAS